MWGCLAQHHTQLLISWYTDENTRSNFIFVVVYSVCFRFIRYIMCIHMEIRFVFFDTLNTTWDACSIFSVTLVLSSRLFYYFFSSSFLSLSLFSIFFFSLQCLFTLISTHISNYIECIRTTQSSATKAMKGIFASKFIRINEQTTIFLSWSTTYIVWIRIAIR